MEILADGDGRDEDVGRGPEVANAAAKSVLIGTPSALLCFEGYGSFQSILKVHESAPPIRERVVIDIDDGVTLHYRSLLLT